MDLIIIPSVGPLPGYEHRIIDAEQVVLVESEPENNNAVELRELPDRQLILVPDACGLTTFTRDLFSSRGLPMRTYPGEALSYRVLEERSTLGVGAALLPASRVSDAAPRQVLDDGMEVEIFYEAVWKPSSALSADLGALATLVQQPSSA